MDIRGLKYFIKAAECLNFTQAAKECFITQTAMSQHINKMEEDLGFQLFYRSNRKVTLTLSGRDFYERAKIIVDAYEDAVQRSRHLANGGSGNVCIAVTGYLDGLLIMPRIRQMKKQYPTTNVMIEITEPRLMMDRLKTGRADIAFGYPGDWGQDDDLVIQNVADFKVSILCRNDHRFASMKKVDPKLIKGETSVLTGLSPFAEQHISNVQMEWAELGIFPKHLHEVSSLENIMLTIMLNNSISLLPEYIQSYIRGERDAKNSVVFKELDMPRPPMMSVVAAYLKDRKNPSIQFAMDALLDSRVPLNY